MNKNFTITIIIFLAVLITTGDANAAGGYTGSFMQLPLGARPTALGGAYMSISDDGSGPLFNPAGVANIQQPLFSSSYRSMSLDRKLGYLTVMFPARQSSVIGINWLYAGTGDLPGRNQDGDLTGNDYGMNSHDIGIVFAKRFEDYISAGVKLRYLQSKMNDLTAFSVGFDFGFMLYVDYLFDREKRDLMPVQNIQIGVAVKNIAGKYRWDTSDLTTSGLAIIQQDDVPVEFGIGASARFLNRKLILATDILYSKKLRKRLHAGAEYFFTPEIALRTGYSDGRLTAGTGYLFNLSNMSMAIDYAYSTDKVDEGSEHIFSFDIMF